MSLRVAHIIKATRISGAEAHLLALLPGLRERGVDARLIMLVEPDKPMDDMLQRAEACGIPTSRLSIGRDIDPRALWKLRRAIRGIKPDLLHTHLVHADLYGYLAGRAAGASLVISSRHNDDPFRYRDRWRRIHRWLWRRVDAGIAISHAIKNFAVEIEDAPAEKITVVHYGDDSLWQSDSDIREARERLRTELGLPPDARILGMVCRLVEQKGIPYALDATRRVQDSCKNTHLVIAGDGEKAVELRRLAKALGIAERAHWLGWREDAADLMAGFDILLMPSLWEGFGLVLLEAMSRRVPVIASRVSAIPEIVVHGETGILIEPRDVEGMAAAITRLLSDRTLRMHMGLLAAARVEEHFSRQRMVDNTLKVYRELLNRR